jgi:hypothetical protein
MAFNSPNMSLRVWDLSTDGYSHAELAANWNKVDTHDHSPGKGVKIGTSGILNGAITGALLADNSVGSAKIIDGSIQGQDIADGAIGADQLAPGVISVPLGTIVPWWRKDGTVPVPTGWELCDGRNWSAVSNDLGVSAGTMPDLRNRFILGAGGSGPGENTTGGSHTKSFFHTHAVDAHSHTVSDHAHSISGDGDHRHYFPQDDGANSSLRTRRLTLPVSLAPKDLAVSTDGVSGLEATFVPNNSTPDGSNGDTVDMKLAGGHSHGGATGSAGASTTSSNGSNTQPALSASTDIRPAYLGVLYIMRVRNV